jgi:asparagine synthase (glutamine-hydrolysing)
MTSLPAAERSRLYLKEVAAHINLAATAATLTDTFDGFQHGTSVDRALKTDLRCYLPDDILTLTDRLSMWHSLELRVPYLDHRLVEEVMTIPSRLKIRGLNQKHILKQVAARWLPEAVIRHRKQGFEAPMGRWLRGPLRALLQDTLTQDAVADCGVFDWAQIERLRSEHLCGARKHSKLLFSMLMFQLWWDTRHKATSIAAGTTHRAATFAA